MLNSLLASFIFSFTAVGIAFAASAPTPCEHVVREGNAYDVCRFKNDASTNVRTYWKDTHGNPYGTLLRFSKAMGPSLVFACNGSASQSDLTPAGLFILDSKEFVPIVKPTDDGLGNIFIRPNGVVFVDDKGHADVRTTEEYMALGVKPVSANQSGPMLLVNGEISRRLDPKGTSLKTRNAVCVGDDLIFAISTQALNFYSFAGFLKTLGCKNALNLDVTNSSVLIPSLNRHDLWTPIGAILAVTSSPSDTPSPTPSASK